jgi:hypothetical protein
MSRDSTDGISSKFTILYVLLINYKLVLSGCVHLTDFDWMTNFLLLFLDVVGGSDGSIRMFEFMHPEQITLFRAPGQNERVNKIAFNPMGNKVRILL